MLYAVPSIRESLPVSVECLFILVGNFTAEIFIILTCCEHLFCSTILHLTVSCPKSAVVSDFSGDISIKKFCAIFCNVNTPLTVCEIMWKNIVKPNKP